MELWIRSQNRKKLVKSGYLTLFLSDNNWFIYSDTTTGEPFEIGKYKTKERALEVLDEIQTRIINLQLVELEEKGQARKDARINDELKCIYEMPEE